MTRKVCLHRLIQNSLAQYLNFKWSKNKLNLKKCKKISKNYDCKCNAVEKKSQPDKKILNLQNDVFVFNSKTKTFNQLDLCECFQEDELEYKNGLCVNTKISEDLLSRKQLENKNDVIGDVKRKMMYSDQSETLKQEKNIRFVGKLIPSKQPEPLTYQDKFSYFIQNEFNKCSGKNLTVRSFTASSRDDSIFDGKNNVQSSSLGFYTITTFDQALKTRSTHKTKLQGTAFQTNAFGRILTVAKNPYEQRFSSKRKAPLPEVTVPIVWVLGGPGSGKGTQCAKIVETYGFTHISSGDLLRNEVKSGSPRGKKLSKIMAKGELVPTETVLELIKEEMLKKAPKSKGFLIDGYPREKQQGILFEEKIGSPTVVIFFSVTEPVLIQRLLKRGINSGRVDDNEETIKKRLQTFNNNNDQIVKHYKDRLKHISAEGTIDDIFAVVRSSLDHLVN